MSDLMKLFYIRTVLYEIVRLGQIVIYPYIYIQLCVDVTTTLDPILVK